MAAHQFVLGQGYASVAIIIIILVTVVVLEVAEHTVEFRYTNAEKRIFAVDARPISVAVLVLAFINLDASSSRFNRRIVSRLPSFPGWAGLTIMVPVNVVVKLAQDRHTSA